MRAWRGALIGLALAIAAASPSAAQTAADGLRGAEPPPAGDSAAPAGRITVPTVTVPTKPYVAPVRPRDTRLTSPSLIAPPLMSPVAPRITGRSEGVGGGSDCRLACARDNYSCLAQDGGDCSATWIKCVNACPEASSSAL